MPRIITSYIWREISVPFILGVLILTLIALLGKLLKLIELVINKGFGLITLFELIIYTLPFFLTYIIPITFLLAVIIAYNRLSGDGEIIALKAAGLSLKQLAMPAIILSIIPFLTTLLITLYAFPLGNLNFKGLLYDMTTSRANIGLREKTFVDDFEGLTLYIDELSPTGKEMKGVFIIDERGGGSPNIVTANHGTLLIDTNFRRITLRLTRGNIHKEEEKGKLFREMSFKSYDINLTPRGTGDPISQKSNRELFLRGLYERIGKIREEGGEPNPYIIDLHKRFTLPFSTFVFTILGVTLGVQGYRRSRLRGFTLALIVTLSYYILSTFLEFLGEEGRLNPILAVWGSNLALGVISIYIFYKSYREQPIKIFTTMDDLIERISIRFKGSR